jgi:hypothetical protein
LRQGSRDLFLLGLAARGIDGLGLFHLGDAVDLVAQPAVSAPT